MTTARDLIKRSLKLLGVYSIGEEPSDDEAQDGLTALNAMMDSWANENLFVHAKTLDVVTLTANQQTFTIGPSGSIISPRPVDIDSSSYIVYQNVSYPLLKWGLEEYSLITVKGQITGIPCGFWPKMDYPNITVTLWPLPYDTMILNLYSNKLIRSFPTLDDTIDLPPGYERAIVYSLAEEIAPEYEVLPSPSVVLKATQSRKNIKRTNTIVPMMQMPYGIPNNNGYTDWRSF